MLIKQICMYRRCLGIILGREDMMNYEPQPRPSWSLQSNEGVQRWIFEFQGTNKVIARNSHRPKLDFGSRTND